MKPIILSILTGLSGSGKTTALRILEQLGFFCVDNLPASLLGIFLDLVRQSGQTATAAKRLPINKIALVIDARGRDFFKDLSPFMKKWKGEHRIRLLYIESRDDILINRYQAARQKHPLAEGGSIGDGIEREKKILAPLRQMADKVVDTSDINAHELKNFLLSYFHDLIPRDKMQISLMSFGYKYGIPIHADMVLDVRFLNNPFFVRNLKNKTGHSQTVQSYVLKQKACQKFVHKIVALITFLNHEYKKGKRSYLNIAFGCTGGRHRSVVIAETLRKILKKKKILVGIVHRDEKVCGKEGLSTNC